MDTTHRSTNPGGDAQEAHNLLVRLDLAGRLPEVGRHLTVADDRRKRAKTNTDAEARATRQRLIGQVVAGQLDPDEAAAQAVQAEEDARRTRTAADFHKASAQAAEHAAWKVLTGAGDALVNDLLAPEAAKVVQTVTKAVETLGEVSTPEEAIQAGGKVLTAWGKLDAARRRWDLLQELADHLRSQGAIPVTKRILTEANLSEREHFQYHRPENIDWGAFRNLTPPLQLAAQVTAGAEPGILTAVEVEAVWDRQDAEEAAERATQRPARGRRTIDHITAATEVDDALTQAGFSEAEKQMPMDPDKALERNAARG